MGKPSSSKKVSRVARTGGGRTRKAQSWLFPSIMALVVIFGIVLVVVSRDQNQPDNSAPRAGGLGREGDHWHAAIGYYICGQFAPDIADETDPLGIHTHSDGVVHIHPFTARAAGESATLSVFFDAVGATVTSDELSLPGSEGMTNGDECDGEPGRVETKIWPTRDPDEEGEIHNGDPGDLKLENNQLITVAFVPEGTDIPRPPSEPNLDRLTDVPGATTTPTTTPESTTTTTPEGSTTSGPPGDSGTGDSESDSETSTTSP